MPSRLTVLSALVEDPYGGARNAGAGVSGAGLSIGLLLASDGSWKYALLVAGERPSRSAILENCEPVKLAVMASQRDSAAMFNDPIDHRRRGVPHHARDGTALAWRYRRGAATCLLIKLPSTEIVPPAALAGCGLAYNARRGALGPIELDQRAPTTRNWLRSGLLAPDGSDTVDSPVERQDRSDVGGLGLRHEIRLGEVQAIQLVDLKGTQQRGAVDGLDRGQRKR